MLVSGQVGPITRNTSLRDGSTPIARLGNMGELVTSNLHGKFYESTYRKNMYTCANQSLAFLSSVFTTTTTLNGLIISNPVNSNTNVILNLVTYALTAALPANAVFGLVVGNNKFGDTNSVVTHTAPLTPVSTNLGSPNIPIALVDSIAVVPTAVTYALVFGSAISTNNACTTVLDGSIILSPGSYAAISSTVASTAAQFMGSFTWEEFPI